MPAQARGPINPYVVGQTIKGEYGFYGRQNLVEAVVNTLTTTQQNTIVLHGQRRIGKSSLLHRLRRDQTLAAAHLPIFFDMQLRQGFPLARILADLAQTISDELSLSISLPDETSLAADYHRFQRRFLPKIYRYLGHKRLLILFDEFDAVVPSYVADRFPADTLLGYLQVLTEEDQKRLAFLFVVGQRLDLLAEGYRRLFRGARTEPVGRLGRKDAYELLTELGQQGNINYADDALAEIWALTNGHPYLTQLLGSEIFDHLQKQATQQASATDVEACLDKAMEHGLGALDWFWRGFNREEKLVLAAVANLTDRDKSITDVEIAQALQRHLFVLTDVARRNAYRQLIQGDFLLDVGRRRYQFAVEFIRRWIVTHHSLKEAQRQSDQSSPEAQRYYQLGLQAYQKGDLTEAVKNYRRALLQDPGFFGPQLAMAQALRAQRNIQAAIAEYEKAYQLDPAGAREELIELRLNHAHDLEKADDEEAALAQARHILKIDPYRAEARQLLSDIYLRQVSTHLERFKLAEALDIVQNLIEPLPIIQDIGVAQCIRKLWSDYSQKLTERKPPRWDEAQRSLDSLESLGLLDETIRINYNQVTLNKARAFLDGDRLDQALATLQDELKPPLPATDVKELVLSYGYEQVDHERWPNAAQALEGLCHLIEDEESKTTLLDLYQRWGDILLNAKQFDEAIEVYRRHELWQHKWTSTDFKQRITDAYLLKAARHLDRHELAEAEAGYGQALAILNTSAIQERTRLDLETYFHGRCTERDWEQAESVLRIFQKLGLVDENTPNLQVQLYMAQAEGELEQSHLDAAFQHLAALDSEAEVQIKTLVKTYLQNKGHGGQWATGAAVLKRLHSLFVGDDETTWWRANWLFLWALALFSKGKPATKLARAKYLCQKILGFAPDETPAIDLLATSPTTAASETTDLRYKVCALLADILLEQAQVCLDHGNLTKAQDLFKNALTLPIPPEHLAMDIQGRLQSFSQKIRGKDWTQARRALEMILRLGIGGPEINELLTDLAISQANLLLKGDQPEQAFSILNQLKTEMEGEKRQKVKTLVYNFSRLYAGRHRWEAAKQVLKCLSDWLAPADEEELAHLLNALNEEWLQFIRGKRLATKPLHIPVEEVGYLEEEVRVTEEGLKDAEDIKRLKPEAPDTWVGHFIETSLQLGQTYLANNNLTDAIQTYRQILDREGQGADHKKRINNQISQSLYGYSERMLFQKQENRWDEAHRALESLKSLSLPGPDGQTRPDPRVNGAIQRVLLSHARALLEEDRAEEAFSQLQTLPQQWPEGEIKGIIRGYAQKRCAQDDWPHAIAALQHLNELLVSDQEALTWLVDALEQRGHHLEKNKEFEQAADAYSQALAHTGQLTQPRSFDLASHYIRVALQLARQCLSHDPLTSETPPLINQAIQRCQEILALPEHDHEHERQINETLHDHTLKLAGAGQWQRAHQVLDHLDILYPIPRDQDKTIFATWRRKLALAEIQNRLAERQIDAAFARLGWLKEWLSQYKCPKVTWTSSEGDIKSLVDDFCRTWLHDEAWDPIIQTLGSLARLLPNDADIKGWQVKALCQWGQSLQRNDLLEEARIRYEQALEEAPNQDTVPISEIERPLMETLLAQAQQCLDLEQRNLPAAVAIYKRVLQKRDDQPEYAERIRQALKGYSASLIQQATPDWKAASEALDNLDGLNLRNSQVSKWRQELLLQEMEAMLHQDNLEAAFASLEALERPWPVDIIQGIVHHYSQTRVGAETWSFATEALRKLGDALAEDTSARQWVVEELTALGNLLETQNNLPGAEAAYELAVEFY